MADPGEGPGGRSPSPLFLDQKGAQRAEKNFFETGPPPYLKVWIATDNGTTSGGVKSHVIIQVVRCILIEFSSFQS